MQRHVKQPRSPSRTTRQKLAIVECLAANRGKHLSADGLFDLLRQAGTPVGQATVYRALKTLEREGMVKKYFIPEGTGACYQYSGDSPECGKHCHLVCERCGAVVHMGSDRLATFVAEARGQSGFAIDERRLAFYGLCEKCIGGANKGGRAPAAPRRGRSR